MIPSLKQYYMMITCDMRRQWSGEFCEFTCMSVRWDMPVGSRIELLRLRSLMTACSERMSRNEIPCKLKTSVKPWTVNTIKPFMEWSKSPDLMPLCNKGPRRVTTGGRWTLGLNDERNIFMSSLCRSDISSSTAPRFLLIPHLERTVYTHAG